MPARSERIYLVPSEDAEPCRVMRFPVWWNRSEFFKKYRQREIDLGNPSYEDFALLLTQWEATGWDEHCREQFSSDPRSNDSNVVEEMSRFELDLSKAKWVIVESYEWESGLD